MSDSYQPPRQPTVVEFLLNMMRQRQQGNGNAVVRPNPGAPPRSMAQAQGTADSAAYFRNNAMPAFVGQNGPIAPSDPFDQSAPSGGTVQGPQAPMPPMAPPRTVVNPQPNYGNPQFAESAFPGGGGPLNGQTALPGEGPTVRDPMPVPTDQIIAQMLQMDPTAFAGGSAPPAEALPAFADLPVGDTLNIQNPWPVTPPQGGPQAPAPQMVAAPPQMPRPQVAPPTSAVAPPIMPTPMRAPMPDPFAVAGGPPPVAPRPFVPPAAVPPVASPVAPRPTPMPQPQGMLRRPPIVSNSYAIAPPTPQGPSPELLANSFLHSQPIPPGGPPPVAAAPTVKSPPVVPPAQGGAQVTGPAPAQGAKMPEHLKDQLLAEAVRLTAKKRGTMPAGAP